MQQAEVPRGKRHWSQPAGPDAAMGPLRHAGGDGSPAAAEETEAAKAPPPPPPPPPPPAAPPPDDQGTTRREAEEEAPAAAEAKAETEGGKEEGGGGSGGGGGAGEEKGAGGGEGGGDGRSDVGVGGDTLDGGLPPPLPPSREPSECGSEREAGVDTPAGGAEGAEKVAVQRAPEEHDAVAFCSETSTPVRSRSLPNGVAKDVDVDVEAGYTNAAFEAEGDEGPAAAGGAAPKDAAAEDAAATTGAAVATEEPRRPRRVSFSERPPLRAVYDAAAPAPAPAPPVDPAARAVKEQGLGSGERWRILRNVALLSAAFMLLFTAFFGAANLQSSVNADHGLGTISLTAVYASIIVSNLFLPSVVIRWLGCKWTVACAMVLFSPYAAAQLSASWATLVPTALVLGASAAPMWCAKCSYLNSAAGAYAAVTGAPRDLVMVRFFGLFYVLFPLGHVWGNLITSEVLSTTSAGAAAGANASLAVDVAAVCGANFCPSARSPEANPNLARPPDHLIRTIGLLFVALTIIAALLVAFGVDNLRRYGEGSEEAAAGGAQGEGAAASGGAALLVATLRLLGDRNQLLLVPITAFIGISQAFLGADFTESYIACAWGIPYIGYVLMGYGLASSLASVAVSWVVRRAGRLPVVAASVALFLLLVAVLRWWTPRPGHGAAYVLLAAAWGLADSTALVINAMYGLLFRGREAAAYSNFSLWGSAGFIATYSYSPRLCATSKLAILAAVLLLSLCGFVLAERALRRLLAAEEHALKRQQALAEAGVSVVSDKAHAA